MEIERIETQWASPQIQEYVEHLREIIAREFMIPAYLLDDRYAVMRAQITAHRRTEAMRREIYQIMMTYCWPVLIAKISTEDPHHD